MEENLTKRVLPNDSDAELSVLGSMLMDKDVITQVVEIIGREDFYNPANGLIFQAMKEIHDAGLLVEPVTLQDKLKQMEAPPEIRSVQYIMKIMEVPQSSVTAVQCANIVEQKALMRKIIKVNEELANECYVGKEPVEAILERAEKDVFALGENRGSTEYVPIEQVVLNAVKKIEEAAKNSGSVTGIATGFLDLDTKTAGMQPSDLVLIAARPSMGKTAFVLNIAQHVAIKSQKSVAIFSLEMSKEQLIHRMFSLESHVDAQVLRTGKLQDDEWDNLMHGAENLAQSKLIIDDTPSISISEMRSKCRKYKIDQGLDMIIIDYLQLMSGSVGGRSNSRQEEISEISRSLKALARELQVPVLALSQLSRAVEQRPDKRPMLSDLRESGAIEQDADVAMFIYRDDYYNKETEKKNIAEIIIAKQRNGPIGTIDLMWLPQLTKFANIAHQYNNQE